MKQHTHTHRQTYESCQSKLMFEHESSACSSALGSIDIGNMVIITATYSNIGCMHLSVFGKEIKSVNKCLTM